MRRWQIGVLACALLILLSGNAFAQSMDVSPDHWAYKHVQTLIERGYMQEGTDGAFGGDDPALRYDVAAAVGGLLEDIEAGRLQVDAGADTEMLRALEQEFRAELVEWYQERQQLEAAHGQTQRHLTVIDEQLNALLVALDDLHTAVRMELAAGLTAEATRTDELFEQSDERTDAKLDELSGRVDDSIDGLDRRLGASVAEIDERIERIVNTIDDRIADLQRAVETAFGQYDDAVGERLGEQLDELQSLRDELAQLSASIDGQADDLEQLSSTVDGHGDDLEQLQATVAEQRDGLEDLDLKMSNYINDQAAALAVRLEGTERNVKRLTDDLTSLSEMLRLSHATTGEDVAELQSKIADVQTRLAAVEALSADLATLDKTVQSLQQEMAELHDVFGSSEDQIARLADRVALELDDQLALTLSRERRLERQLNELRDEFEGYKVKADEEIKSARNMGAMALGVAALAVLLGLMN